jgi:hypothetical protein
MKIHGQRWRYQLANTEINVDNGFSWLGWAQERLQVNGEVAQSAGGWLVFRRSFKEPWLTPTGDGEVSIQMRPSASTGIQVDLRLDNTPVEYVELFESTWTGRGSWPEETDWIKIDRFSFWGPLNQD